MATKQSHFEDLLDEVAELLQSVAEQQATPDDSWREQWVHLREKLEASTDEAFSTYSE